MLTNRCLDDVWDVVFKVIVVSVKVFLDTLDRYATKYGCAFDVENLVVIVLSALDETAIIHLTKDRDDIGLNLPMGGNDDFGACKYLEHIDRDRLLDICLYEVDV